MKNRYFFSFLILLFLGIHLSAQTQRIHFRNATWAVDYQASLTLPQNAFSEDDNHFYGLIVFQRIPTEAEKKELSKNGISLSGYMPDNSFYARISSNGLVYLNSQRSLVHAVLPTPITSKASNRIQNNEWHSECLLSDGRVLTHLHLYEGASIQDIISGEEGIELVSNESGSDAYALAIPASSIPNLLNQPGVLFLEEFDQKGEPENYNGRAMSRINKIQAPNGTYYDGSGSVVGHGDDGDIGPHIDYTGRILYNRSNASSGNHGDHVAGTILGGGIYDPDGMGMAPGADLVYSSYPSNFTLVDQDYVNYNVRITTSSYSNGCNAGYTSTTQQVDNDIIQNPKLMHVYSAGNSGSSDCGYGAGSGWGNLTGGHKAGKNVIASANVTSSDVIASSSSRGPASDGRIKPDVAALGSSVYSSVAGNGYASYTGTSMACPGISGGLAVLLEAFKDNNNGQEPDGGLLKAILQNTADDLGNSGPDFIYGYGRMNIERGVELISSGQHITGTISQGGNAAHSIPVPANVSQLKVMVYWTDPAASPSSGKALVNNINSYVERSNQTWNPWVLDPTPNSAALSSAAVRAVDTLNNMEQVTIDNPTQGDHIVRINGASIPQGPQKYYVVYSFIMNGISVDFPSSGVAIEPGQSTTIRWNASPSSSSFNLEYSLNGGASWSSIGTSSATTRQRTWTPPSSAATGNAQIRITRGATSAVGSDFTIIGQPSNIQFLWTCPDSTHVAWNFVTGAAGYQVNVLGARDMDSVATASTNNVVVNGLPSAQDLWFSVQAITPEGTLGKRSIAVERPAGLVSCPATCILSGTVVQTGSSTTSLDLDLSNPLTSSQSYSIEYGPAGFTPGTGTTFTSNTSSFTISGLTASTVYDVYVKALCQNGSFTNTVFGSFSTSCATYTLPYSSNMSSASFTCWTASDPTYVYINNDCPSTGNSELTLWGQAGLHAESADILTQGQSTITVDFDYYDPQVSPCGENADAGEQVAIGWVSPSGVFTQMAVYDGGTAPTTPTSDQFIISLNGENSIRIRMEVLSGTSNQFDNWAFDNILVTGGGSICNSPTNLGATNITSTGATLNWTAGNIASTNYAIEYGLPGFTAGTGTVFNSSNTSYSILILNPNTTYEYFVTETCSDGSLSAPSQRFSFSTLAVSCASFTAPYSQDFETAALGAQNDFNNCWTSTNGTSNPLWTANSGGTGSINTGPLGDNGTGSGIYLYTEASSPAFSGDTISLLSPSIDVSSLTTPLVEFYYHMYGAAMGILHVDVFDGTNWNRDVSTIVGEQQTANADPFNLHQVALPGYTGTIQVRLRAEMGPISGISSGSTFYGDMAIDDFSVSEAPLCMNPSSLAASSISDSSAMITWNSTHSSFEVEYGPSGFTPGNGTAIIVSSSFYAINGLSSLTSYDVYVRANCGPNGFSNWSGPLTFTTLACAATNACTYTVTMTDAFGDGWNGAIVDLVSGNTVVASFGSTFTTGSGPITETFNLCDGLSLDVIGSVAGSFPSEVGFTITDPNGAVVFTRTSGASFTSGTNFGNFTTNCGPVVCPTPTNLSIGSITSTDALVSWTGSSNSYEVQYGPSGFNLGSGTSGFTSTSFITISNLVANTAYNVYVRSDCGAQGYSNWEGPISFTTASGCATVTAPYSEDFDNSVLGAQTDFGNCWLTNNGISNPRWTANTGTTSSSSTGPSGDNTTGAGVYLYTEASSPAVAGDTIMLYSPIIDISGLNSPYLEFYYHMYGEAMGILHVDILNAGSWVRDFITIAGEQHISILDPFTFAGASLSGLSNTIQIRFRGEMGPLGTSISSTFYGDMSIDDVSVGEAPACLAPTNITASGINSNSIILSWNSIEPSFEIEYGPTGFALGSGTSVIAQTTSATISGLTSATSYDFYVRANCGSGGNSSWIGPVSFTTLCTTSSIPYLRDFDNTNWPPICWTLGGTRTVVQTNSDYMEASFWAWNSGQALATTEPITISSDARVKFNWAHLYSASYPLDQMILQARLSNSNTWDTLVNFIGPTFTSPNALSTSPPSGGDGDFLSEIINLDPATYTGQDVIFQFVFNTGYGPDVFVDDFIVESLPACPDPTSLTVGTVGANSATVNWNSNAASFDIEYGLSGFNLGNGISTSSSTDSVSLTGLSTSSSYQVYVRANCGPLGTSPWVGPITFTTNCQAVSLPYLQDFTSATLGSALDFGNCWTSDISSTAYRWEAEDSEGINENSLNTGPFYDNTSFGIAGGKYMYAEASYTGSTTYMTSPIIDLGNASYPSLEFFYHMYGATTGSLDVQASSDGGATWNSIFTILGQQQTSGADNWTAVNIQLTGLSGQILIRFGANKGTSFDGDICIDDFKVEDALVSPVCLAPSNLSVSLVQSTQAQLEWTPGDSEPSWEVNFGLSGFSGQNGTQVVVLDSSYLATGLTAGTSYDYFVRAICAAGDTSIWTGPYSFSTPSGCAVVAPFTEDFESANLGALTDFGNCWTSNNSASNPSWTANQGTTSSFATGPSGDNTTGTGTYLYLETSAPAISGDTVMLYSPNINIGGLTNPYLEFYYHMYGAAMGILHVDVFSGGTWTRDVITIVGEQHTADIDPYTLGATLLNGFGNVIQLRFRAEAGPIAGISAGSTFVGDMAIDDVAVGEAPACLIPLNFVASGQSSTSVNLTWTSLEPSFEIEYGPTGFLLGTGNTATSQSTSTSLSGMNPSTSYDVYIRANCGNGGNSNWVGPITFNTLCTSASLPYLRDFDTPNWPPICWTLGGTQTVVQANSDYMEASFWSWNTGQALATTEAINISTDARVKFDWAHLYNSSYPLDQMILQVRLANSNTWDTIANFIGPSFNSPNALSSSPPSGGDTDFMEEIINLDPTIYTGQDVVFQFVFNTNYGPDVFVDDFIVEALPACPDPTGFTVGTIGSNNANLSWNSSATNFEVEYGPSGFTQGSGTIVASNSASFNLTGLNSSTQYEAYVRAVCGAQGTSPWAGPVTFNTPCSYVSLPYSQNFTSSVIGGALDFGNCWLSNTISGYRWEGELSTGVNQNSLNTGPFFDNTSYGLAGGKYMYAEASISGNPAYLTSPVIDLGGAFQPELEFFYHMYGISTGTLDVEISEDGGTSWTNIWTLSGQQQMSGSAPWIQASVPLTSYSGQVIIRFIATRGASFEGDICIDDFSVSGSTPPSICFAPSNLGIGSITHNSATLFWDAGGSEPKWEVSVDLTGLGTQFSFKDIATDTSYHITNLTPSLTYDFYVRAICTNNDTSIWTGPYTFSTPAIPLQPVMDSAIAVNLSKGIFEAHWSNIHASATARKLEYKALTDSTWKVKNSTNPNIRQQRFNIAGKYAQMMEARVAVLIAGNWEYSNTLQFYVDCRPMTLNMFEIKSATCATDSALVRVGFAGGFGAKSIQWSNGTVNKRTYADPGETLYVTITDASGCANTDSITASPYLGYAVPLNFTLTKLNATTYSGSWSHPSLNPGHSMIGYRMAYRLRNTQTWTNTSLTSDTSALVDFTGTGNPAGNYEFVAFMRHNTGSGAANSSFTCREVKGYNGSGNKNATESGSDNLSSLIDIYPNPASEVVYVNAPSGSQVQLVDMQGKILGEAEVTEAEINFDMSNLAQGVYMIRITSNDQSVTEQVVKN